MADLFDALDRGFAVVSRVGRASGRPLAADLVLAHAQEIVADDPDAAAGAIFALVVKQSDDPNLKWLLTEWRRKRRADLEQRWLELSGESKWGWTRA